MPASSLSFTPGFAALNIALLASSFSVADSRNR
jgi:hypothetical protein